MYGNVHVLCDVVSGINELDIGMGGGGGWYVYGTGLVGSGGISGGTRLVGSGGISGGIILDGTNGIFKDNWGNVDNAILFRTVNFALGFALDFVLYFFII